MYDRGVLTVLPKAELHVHLEGCLHPGLQQSISARKSGTQVGPLLVPQDAIDNINSFMKAYMKGLQVLQTDEDFFDVAWDYLQRAATYNVVRVEMFFNPQAHLERGVSFESMMCGLSRAADRAGRELGISLVLIMSFLRDRSEESAMAVLPLASPHRDLIVGIGLDGDAADNPPSKFSRVFRQAKQQGFHTTAHCDVVPGQGVLHIREALLDLDLDRLDHAACLLDDPESTRAAVEEHVVITCCPETELLFYGDRGGDKMRRMLQAGVCCTINSDDPGYLNAYLDENVGRMLDDGLEVSEIVAMFRHSIAGSWVSSGRKADALRDFDQILARYTSSG